MRRDLFDLGACDIKPTHFAKLMNAHYTRRSLIRRSIGRHLVKQAVFSSSNTSKDGLDFSLFHRNAEAWRGTRIAWTALHVAYGFTILFGDRNCLMSEIELYLESQGANQHGRRAFV